ncbi:MAG TPA: AMP-binding protein, partial [Burkholderiaceae bacterium]|nr:AMP-binding protein [Burkholderiaceae bacterium]
MQTTFPRLMQQHAAERPQAAALREKEFGIWQTITWGELAALVRDLAGGLAAAGLTRGQHLVVVGSNRPRLYAVMLAAQALGAVPIPLYQDAAGPEFVFPINNAEVAFAVVEDQEQVDKLLELRAQCPQLTRIWYDDPRGLRNYAEPGLESLDTLIEAGRAHAAQHPGFFDAEVAKADPHDVAAMFFTSGTTGNPKGVILSHGNIASNVSAMSECFPMSSFDRSLSFLPWAHSFGQTVELHGLFSMGASLAIAESVEKILDNLAETEPTLLFSVPRIFNKLYGAVQKQ